MHSNWNSGNAAIHWKWVLLLKVVGDEKNGASGFDCEYFMVDSIGTNY
jgi:hypothetical protein